MAKNVKVKLDRAGVRELLRSNEVKDYLQSIAREKASGLGGGYETDSDIGQNRANAMIRAVTHEAKRDNLKNNTLLKAVGR